MSNIEHVKEWTTALRSGAYQQVDATLCKTLDPTDPDTGVAYCCLGVAAVLAGATVEVYTDDGGEDVTYYEANMSDGQDLPGQQTHQWLGIAEGDDNSEKDVAIDWPPLLDQDGKPYTMTCAALNDNLDLTFEQIADVVDYFGIG